MLLTHNQRLIVLVLGCINIENMFLFYRSFCLSLLVKINYDSIAKNICWKNSNANVDAAQLKVLGV